MTANYGEAVLKSVCILQDYNYDQVPIDLKLILKKIKLTIRVCSYSKLSHKKSLNIEEICEYFESDFGACAYERQTERYIIYYNDTKNNIGLERFTIAHELGHIFLNHHNKTDTDIMLRKGISEEEYKIFENEANCFARNFLSPQPLVSLVTDISKENSVYALMDAFNISFEAANTRKNLFTNDGYHIKAEHKRFFSKYKILYGYYCLTCKNAVTHKSTYCPICGEKDNVFEKGIDRVYYNDGANLDNNLRVLECPTCKNEEFDDKAEFCRICATRLFNYCEGSDQHDNYGHFIETTYHKNPGNARFCETCGAKTVYFSKDILCRWQDFGKDSITDEFPF